MGDLKKRPCVVVRKRHGTAMGVAGDPDLYGTVGGRHFEIEVKRPNDPSSQLTKLQTQRLQEWKTGRRHRGRGPQRGGGTSDPGLRRAG